MNLKWGVGLRPHHYETLPLCLPWLEVMADNYFFHKGGPHFRILSEIANRTSVVVHGVGLNIGSHLPLDLKYVSELARISNLSEAQVVSDHLCFVGSDLGTSFDLLPIPYTKKMLNFICDKVCQVQEILKKPFALENVSSYVSFNESEMSELEFLNEVHLRTGTGILLDVNNVYVSAHNHGLDAKEEVLKVNPKAIFQFHVAGHSESGKLFIDTHDAPVKEDVWGLLRLMVLKCPDAPIILENDDEKISFSELLIELEKGKSMCLL